MVCKEKVTDREKGNEKFTVYLAFSSIDKAFEDYLELVSEDKYRCWVELALTSLTSAATFSL